MNLRTKDKPSKLKHSNVVVIRGENTAYTVLARAELFNTNS